MATSTPTMQLPAYCHFERRTRSASGSLLVNSDTKQPAMLMIDWASMASRRLTNRPTRGFESSINVSVFQYFLYNIPETLAGNVPGEVVNFNLVFLHDV